MSILIPIPKTIALISYAGKVMLKIVHARLQHYVNQEFPDIQAGFLKGRGTRDQIVNIHWIIEKAKEFQKNTYLCFINYTNAFVWIITNCGKLSKEMGLPDHLTCLLRNLYVKKQQLRLYMEQQLGSGLRKENNKAVTLLTQPVC